MRRPNRKPNYAKTENIANWSESAEYVIHKEGDDFIAVNGQTGVEDKRSTNFSTATQHAIDNTTAGAIKINCDIAAFDTALDLEDNVWLDFMGHLMTVTGDPNIFNVDAKEWTGAKNVYITVPNAYAGNIIELECDGAASERLYWLEFENIRAESIAVASSTHAWNGVYVNQDGVSASGMHSCTFKRMHFKGPQYGFHWYSNDENPWATWNHFENWLVWDCTKGYYIQSGATVGGGGNGFNSNTFIHCECAPTAGETTHGFHFTGKCGANDLIHCSNDAWAATIGDANGWNLDATDCTKFYIVTADGAANRTIAIDKQHTIIEKAYGIQGITDINYSAVPDFYFNRGIAANDDCSIWLYAMGGGAAKTLKLQVQQVGTAKFTTSAGDIWLDSSTQIVRFGTKTGHADQAIDGYITMKDDAGNTVYIATLTPT